MNKPAAESKATEPIPARGQMNLDAIFAVFACGLAELVFPFVDAGTIVPAGFVEGEMDGVGLGPALGVPLDVGVGNRPPGGMIAAVVGVGLTPDVPVVGVGLGVGLGVGTGGVGLGGDGGVGLGGGGVVGVGGGGVVGVGGGGVVGVDMSVGAGDEVVPIMAVGVSSPLASVVVCNATIPVTENNSNAEPMARVRKTQYKILVDFLFNFIKPRSVNIFAGNDTKSHLHSSRVSPHREISTMNNTL